ncbi:MAG: hypothetical protein N2322_03925, partial [Terrimicrobiaceae bacterium]|nr:hypothetical protein [Terrimicrobiaceae bacterium]
PTGPVKKSHNPTTKGTGTVVTFKPDSSIFETELDPERIRSYFQAPTICCASQHMLVLLCDG